MTLDEAREAWVAAGKPRKGALWEECQKLVSMAAKEKAAKRAAEEAALEESNARLLREIAAARAERASADAERVHAIRAIRAAYEWPRCGDGFPSSGAEWAAARWAEAQYGSLEAALAANDVYS